MAAHITAASVGGPRFNSSISEKDRRSASNGIWLCQTCAKLIDSDAVRYTSQLLELWKAEAESEADKRIGKTSPYKTKKSHVHAEREIKRAHKLRDELRKAFLKTPAQRMALPRGSAQYSHFAETEFIVHKLGDTVYPDFDKSPGVSNWLKFEVFDFYHNGIECILSIEYVLATEYTKSWSSLPEKIADDQLPAGFWPLKVFKTGKIPWRNIRHYDLHGDEYYPMPHLYCLYADNGMPYEDFGYYIIPEEHSYCFSLPAEGKVDVQKLLSLDSHAQEPWNFLS